jgi:hypothetical protein
VTEDLILFVLLYLSGNWPPIYTPVVCKLARKSFPTRKNFHENSYLYHQWIVPSNIYSLFLTIHSGGPNCSSNKPRIDRTHQHELGDPSPPIDLTLELLALWIFWRLFTSNESSSKICRCCEISSFVSLWKWFWFAKLSLMTRKNFPKVNLNTSWIWSNRFVSLLLRMCHERLEWLVR